MSLEDITTIRQNPALIQYAQMPSEEMVLAAVETNSQTFKLINISDQSSKVCWAAIKQDVALLYYVACPTEDMIKYALDVTPYAITYVREPSLNVLKHAIKCGLTKDSLYDPHYITNINSLLTKDELEYLMML